MKESDTVIIFVQASRDIVYALNILETYKEKDVRFYVVDNLSNYKALKEILPDYVSISFIRNYKFSNPCLALLDSLRLRLIYIREFHVLKSCKVFFFSNYFDYKTYYLVSELSKKNSIVMVDHYGIIRNDAIPRIKDHIRRLIILLITFRWCRFTGEARVPTFDLENYGIYRELSVVLKEGLIDKYKYKLPLERKSVIIFDLVDAAFLFNNYTEVIDSIVDLFIRSGYSVYIKPHPRSEVSPSILNKQGVYIIQVSRPSELIDFSNFNYAVSAVSASICNSRVINKAFSIINLLVFNNSEKKHEYKEYLQKLDRSIMFPELMSDIETEISE